MAEIKYNLGTLAVVPSGSVIPFAGSTAPQGYLLCDGREVSRADYPFLFSVIGTTYGEGDGNTTFNLPNLQDKFIQGAGTNTVGTEKSAGLPNITGYTNDNLIGYQSPNAYGAIRLNANYNYSSAMISDTDAISTNTRTTVLRFDASLSNSIYGNSDTVQPPAICMNYIIKY